MVSVTHVLSPWAAAGGLMPVSVGGAALIVNPVYRGLRSRILRGNNSAPPLHIRERSYAREEQHRR